MSNQTSTVEQDFEQTMMQRIQDNFAVPGSSNIEISDERLKEMNKKLPEWSLEPPYSFLK